MKWSARRGGSALLAGALAAALGLAAPGGAQAAASAWSAPITVARTPESLDSSGAAVSSWYQQTPQNTFAAQVSSSADSETWTPPITLDQGVEIARCGDREAGSVQVRFAIAEHGQICAFGRRKSVQQISDRALAEAVQTSNQFLRDKLIVVHLRGMRGSQGRHHGLASLVGDAAPFAARV